MSVEPNTRELVNAAASDLAKQGINPTVERIRAAIGRGSATTISDQLRTWRKTEEGRKRNLETPLPNFLVEANRALLEQAEAAAMEKFSEERAGYANEIDSLRSTLGHLEVANADLMAELASLRDELQAKEVERQEAQTELQHLRAEHAAITDSLHVVRAELATKDATLSSNSAEFSEALLAAESRMRGMEKTMLLEIDKARTDTKEAHKYAHQKAAEYQMDAERVRRAADEQVAALRGVVNRLNEENGRLNGLLEAASKQHGVERRVVAQVPRVRPSGMLVGKRLRGRNKR